ncbi:MAG: LysR family transcriptional regulator [Pseudoruegeria sp.]
MKNIENYSKQVSISENYASQRLVWDDTRAFLAVARHGTLTSAATSLGVGIATLSRHIDRLEATLNLPLFIRLQSGYQLTEDGQELVEKAEQMEAAALSFSTRAVARAEISGKIRLATAETLATSLILPALGEFRRKHPNLLIEIVTDINTANLHRRDADIAVRLLKPERGNVTVKRLGTLAYGLYCSQEYASLRKVESDAASYDLDDFIAWSELQAHLPSAQWIERILHGRQAALHTTSLIAQVAAAKASLGLAVLPHFVAQDAKLICLDADLGFDQPIYLVMQADLSHSPRTRALADFLSDLVRSNRGRLSGYDLAERN